jgi:hypothetical protein
LQNRLYYAKIGADVFDRVRGLFDVVNGLNEELNALKGSRSNTYNGGSDAERVHPNKGKTRSIEEVFLSSAKEKQQPQLME